MSEKTPIPFSAMFGEKMPPGDTFQIAGKYNSDTQMWEYSPDPKDTVTTTQPPGPLPPPTLSTLLTRAEPYPVPDLVQDD